MKKLSSIACACLLAISVGGAGTLAASSPDCARWVREYQHSLHTHAVNTKHRVVKAARHLQVRRPVARSSAEDVRGALHPHLSSTEMLRRFRRLCGDDLPGETSTADYMPTEDSTLAPRGLPEYTPSPRDVPSEPFVPAISTPGDSYPVTGSGSPPIFVPVAPGGGSPIVPPITVPPVIAPVPEPSSLVLVLLGVGAITVAWLKHRLIGSR